MRDQIVQTNSLYNSPVIVLISNSQEVCIPYAVHIIFEFFRRTFEVYFNVIKTRRRLHELQRSCAEIPFWPSLILRHFRNVTLTVGL